MSVSINGDVSHKQPSRSNSISSVVTIKKSASVSSRGESGPSYLRNRSTSPDSISRVLHSLNSSRSEHRSRGDPSENRKTGPSLTVNRWSHSTSSSLSAIDADLIRKRTSSIRKSTGYASNVTVASTHAGTSQDYKPERRGSPKRRSSTSNKVSPLPGSRLAFYDSSNLKVVQDLAQPANSSTSTIVSGSTWDQNSSVNKFGDPLQSLSIHYIAKPTHHNSDARPATDNAQVDAAARSSHGRTKDTSQNKHSDKTRPAATTTEGTSTPSDQPVTGDSRSPRRRDMLSRALAKANEAVQLDNAQNANAAIEAYNEACELLQQVMFRSVDLADRRKLSSIKATYSKRIAELHDFDNTFVDLMRPLPDEPPVEDYDNPEDFYQEESIYEPVEEPPAINLPMRQESLLPEIFGGDTYIHDRTLPSVPSPLPNSQLNAPMDEKYMPQPLSPRPLLLPPMGKATSSDITALPVLQHQEGYTSSTEPTQATWLDHSYVYSSQPSSRLSSIDYGRKDSQLMSAIEAEFDAMNAAVDAAYDDEAETPRYAEKITTAVATNRYDHLTNEYLDDGAEEEERMLEEVAQNPEGETQYNQHNVSALPRTSDSSGFSGRTWGSSVASTSATTRTTLSTLAEIMEPPLSAPPTSALPEPPKLRGSEASQIPPRPQSVDKHVGIRDRRLSGQSAKQLRIETFARRGSSALPVKLPQTVSSARSDEDMNEPLKEIPPRTLAPAASFNSSFSIPQPLTPMLSVHSGEVQSDESPATPALTQGASTDDGTLTDSSPLRHVRMMPPPPGPIQRKPLVSSNLGKGTLQINTAHLDTESPMTPGSFVFPNDSRKPMSSASATSAASTPGVNVLTSVGLDGAYLFEDYTGDVRSPASPTATIHQPVPLEPCPDAFLLRPYWLMRCLYQSLAHPRGGYISTKLFLPRDIWRARNVKIKAVEDKVAQCDLLTAALQKLAKVDTLDAAAVLEELQAFETILDQVRMALSKKLGSDVGVTSSSSVFRSSPATEDGGDPSSSKHGNSSSAAKSKSFASGWRKLRSKSSSANMNTSIRPNLSSQNLTMSSLPMTSLSSVATSRTYSNTRQKYLPPTPSSLPQMLAPHAYYMASLARLFDAVQILDSIARQVEDPGLKYSSQTHVGIEFSIRNAAEFFAFYILRFVMSDVLMLLDKFLKRGMEWVTT